MKARDKRALRVAHNRARWADAWAPVEEQDQEQDDDATDFEYIEPTGEDISYIEARRMYG